MTLSVIVVAAGSGERLGSASPKAFVTLAGKTLLENSLQPLLGLDRPLQVVVVAPEGWLTPAHTLADSVLTKGVSAHDMSFTVVAGGATRTESVRRGLAAVDAGNDYVLIHDAARALTPTEVFQRVIDALEAGHQGVIPVLPVVDTIVPVDPDTSVTAPAHPREELGAVQTPQGFHTASLKAAYEQFGGDATDDAAVLRAAGHDVVAVAGHRESVKVTYPEDLRNLERVVGGVRAPGGGVMVGTGVDVHQFDPSKPLVLGGMDFPGVAGLAGHSDGDVIVHAITDALLAASSLGDLGTHFGVNRPEYEGVASTALLTHALGLLRDAGVTPTSVSVQYIANHPKIGPVRKEMCEALSVLVGAPVHVAGTTTDGLGLTGRGEGAAAIATALVVPHELA
ncbi:2-C-methyl-D-erythritol 4-phosphate cytidylyltransferase / 2-C-methyl-D-erythritol 2,4-cyclodiphosphate synthase [Pontimonas salivibrio]|uniref:Bifunctional enzyme IspD/IspF n=1 Tax=Pontimonas salivibrio TaxID=1159327 RepID=A0A2L2BSI2_9MICO|nr:2-C-methyl-D-erythritol 4-phosphate cytidylyltransferase [Pontimonas salivibrio]AVG24633.1 2-C-methyl-D-erythritol 4-phosphate cytidylyltransferase / 2-C-methyl-D-erythritol 2,4-cyclodiphosphate synthase [Pontimonas salivibrio]